MLVGVTLSGYSAAVAAWAGWFAAGMPLSGPEVALVLVGAFACTVGIGASVALNLM